MFRCNFVPFLFVLSVNLLAADIDFNIPAQSLDGALNALAAQAKVQMMFDADAVKGFQSTEVKGRLRVEEALGKVIGAAPLQYSSPKAGSFVISRKVADGRAPQLPEVVVEGQKSKEPAPALKSELPKPVYAERSSTTALKTDTPLIETPQSVQIINRQLIQDQALTRVEEATRYVSGVSKANNFGGTLDSALIRGFFAYVYRDGFRPGNLDRGQGRNGLANVERVEVIKGPSSVLYGRIEPGGFINIVSKKPQEKAAYSSETTVGSYDRYRQVFDATGAVTDDKKLLYRVVLDADANRTFVDYADNEEYFAAPSLLWKPLDSTSFLFQYQLEKSSLSTGEGSPIIGNRPGDFPIRNNYSDHWERSNTLTHDGMLTVDHKITEDWKMRAMFHVRREMNDTHDSRPNSFDEATNVLQLQYYRWDHNNLNYNSTVDFTGTVKSGPLTHKLLIGGDFSHYFSNWRTTIDGERDTDVTDFESLPRYPHAPSIRYNTEDKENNLGLYFQDQIYLPCNVIVMGGLRYDINQQSKRLKLDGEIANSQGAVEGGIAPRVGVLYQPLKNRQHTVSLYASWMNSFQPQTGVMLAGGEQAEPQNGCQYEGGVKTESFGGKLNASLVYFDLKKGNVPTEDPQNPGFSRLVGSQISRGVELDFQANPLPGLNFIGSYSYNDTYVVKDDFIPKGRRFSNVPYNSGSIFGTYYIQGGMAKGLGFGLGAFYEGERIDAYDNTYALPSYFVTNASLYYRRQFGKTKMEFGLHCKNVFDREYYPNVYFKAAVPAGEPTTVEATLKFSW